MNSSKFEPFALFANCFHLPRAFFLKTMFLMMLLFPYSAGATVSVTLHLESETHPLVVGHKIYVREENQGYDFSKPVWQGADTTCVLSGLEENITYFFVARTYDQDGNTSDNSNEIRFLHDQSGGSQDPNASGQEGGGQAVDPKPGPVISTDALDPGSIKAGQLASSQWRISQEENDLIVFDATITPAATQIEVPRLVLKKDTSYYYVVRYVINGAETLEWSPRQTFFDSNLMLEDANSDGIPDTKEVDAQLDLDGDGTPDLYQENMRCIKSATGDQNIGLKLQGDHKVAAIEAVETIAVAELSRKEDIEFAPLMPFGLINLRARLTTVGDTAVITVYLPSSVAIEQNFWWYTYDNIHGWADHRQFAAPGIAKGTVLIKVTDGGAGDADGVANGIIVSQSGVATSPAKGSGGSSSSCFIDSLF